MTKNKIPVWSVILGGVLSFSNPAVGQAISISGGKTFIAGQITVPPTWNPSEQTVENEFFRFTIIGNIVKNDQMPSRMATNEMYTVKTVEVNVGERKIGLPLIGMVRVGKREDFSIFLTGKILIKRDIGQGVFKSNVGKRSYTITSNGSLRKGDSIPAFMIGDFSIYSVQAASVSTKANSQQPLLMISRIGESRASALTAYKIERKYIGL
jgi:hypothetical protein